MQQSKSQVTVVGGAGFIGSHVSAHYLKKGYKVKILDNFSSGTEKHIASLPTGEFKVYRGDIAQTDLLDESLRGSVAVIHLAANPDISIASKFPRVDFELGTLLTQEILDSMIRVSVPQIVYASGSGVYGETDDKVFSEGDATPSVVSTYGASKLASEAMISAYASLFGIDGYIFRFGNVVGKFQTHGVVFDFLRRLQRDSARLEVLGDGNQTKTYIHISDVLAGLDVLVRHGEMATGKVSTFNLSTEDAISVRRIAQEVLSVLQLEKTELAFGDSRYGWRGDVPFMRLDTSKARSYGWASKLSSQEAVRRSIEEQISEQ